MNKELEIGKDLGWNCLAIKQDGEQCISFRKVGRYCKKHLQHYIEESSQTITKTKPKE